VIEASSRYRETTSVSSTHQRMGQAIEEKCNLTRELGRVESRKKRMSDAETVSC
jgi:hypothetical protein